MLPALVGANDTLIVQLAPGATLEQELVRTNWPGLAPARLAELTTSVALPVLLRVMTWAAEVVFRAWTRRRATRARRRRSAPA